LVAGNLLLLSAAMPAVGYSDDSGRRQPKREAAKPRSKHKPAKTVRARDTGTQDQPSETEDDDDDGAARVAGACCVGFIGALVDSAANDASDVEHYEGHSVPLSPDRAGPRVPEEETYAPSSFDAREAKTAIGDALHEVREQCVSDQEQLGEHQLTMTFDPSGRAVTAEIAPLPESPRLAECAQALLVRAQVPPFTGEAVVVIMSLHETAPPAP